MLDNYSKPYDKFMIVGDFKVEEPSITMPL